MSPSAIPFVIPDRWFPEVAAGTVRRFGPLLKNSTTGRIVAILQETGRLQEMVGAGNPAGIILSSGQLLSSIAANVQLEQVKRMLLGFRLLNAASLAAAVVGVGVSMAGFTLVLRRLADVERGLAVVHREVINGRLVTERVDVQLATANRTLIDHLLYRAEEAWVRPDAVDVWKQLEGPMDQAQRYWRGLVGGVWGPSIFRDDRFTLEEAAVAYEAVLLLASARLQTLLLLELHAAALHYAREFARWHEEKVLRLTSIDLASARSVRLAQTQGISEEDVRGQLLQTSKRFMEGVQEIHLQVACRPDVVQVLMDKGIRGRDYIEALRNAKEVPLVGMPVS